MCTSGIVKGKTVIDSDIINPTTLDSIVTYILMTLISAIRVLIIIKYKKKSNNIGLILILFF